VKEQNGNKSRCVSFCFCRFKEAFKLNTKIFQKIEVRSQLEKEFNLILRRIIKESLKSISENLDSVVYYILSQKYNVEEEEISDYVAEFSKCLEMIFGKEGKLYIQKMIIVNLYAKIRTPLSQIQKEKFIEGIELAKQKYIQKKQI